MPNKKKPNKEMMMDRNHKDKYEMKPKSQSKQKKK